MQDIYWPKECDNVKSSNRWKQMWQNFSVDGKLIKTYKAQTCQYNKKYHHDEKLTPTFNPIMHKRRQISVELYYDKGIFPEIETIISFH
jgi:hypothetical protein